MGACSTNFINFVRSACNEYKAIHWCFTRPFSPPQVVKGRARETIAMVKLVSSSRFPHHPCFQQQIYPPPSLPAADLPTTLASSTADFPTTLAFSSRFTHHPCFQYSRFPHHPRLKQQISPPPLLPVQQISAPPSLPAAAFPTTHASSTAEFPTTLASSSRFTHHPRFQQHNAAARLQTVSLT